jgi:hypothetical protein
MKASTWMAVALAVATLAACGGGGGDATPATPPTDAVPRSASASSTGMFDWLVALVATAPDDMQALDAASFAPPQPDDIDPAPLR